MPLTSAMPTRNKDMPNPLEVAALLYAKGKLTSALDITEALLQAGIETPEVYKVKGDALFKMGDAKRAESAYRAGLRLYPDNSALNYHLAYILVQQGKRRAADRHFERYHASEGLAVPKKVN